MSVQGESTLPVKRLQTLASGDKRRLLSCVWPFLFSPPTMVEMNYGVVPLSLLMLIDCFTLLHTDLNLLLRLKVQAADCMLVDCNKPDLDQT